MTLNTAEFGLILFIMLAVLFCVMLVDYQGKVDRLSCEPLCEYNNATHYDEEHDGYGNVETCLCLSEGEIKYYKND